MKTIIKTYVPFIAIGLLLACLELSPEAQAVSPPPDGGYPGGNTAEGQNALLSRTTGAANTATGVLALFSNTIGSANSAFGAAALGSNTTGFFNTAIGDDALFSNTSGSANIAIGLQAGTLLTTGDHNIDIGNSGVADESGIIRIGATGVQTTTYVAGIAGQTVGAVGSTCYVDNDGKR